MMEIINETTLNSSIDEALKESKNMIDCGDMASNRDEIEINDIVIGTIEKHQDSWDVKVEGFDITHKIYDRQLADKVKHHLELNLTVSPDFDPSVLAVPGKKINYNKLVEYYRHNATAEMKEELLEHVVGEILNPENQRQTEVQLGYKRYTCRNRSDLIEEGITYDNPETNVVTIFRKNSTDNSTYSFVSSYPVEDEFIKLLHDESKFQ